MSTVIDSVPALVAGTTILDEIVEARGPWSAIIAEGDVLTITAPAKENVYAETSGEVSVVAVGATATVIAKVQVLATDEILGGASAGSSDWEEWN